MLEKGKKFLNICLSTFLLLSIIFLFSVQNVKAEEETDTINPDEIQMSVACSQASAPKDFIQAKETIFPFVPEYHLIPNRTLRAQPSMYVLEF